MFDCIIEKSLKQPRLAVFYSPVRDGVVCVKQVLSATVHALCTTHKHHCVRTVCILCTTHVHTVCYTSQYTSALASTIKSNAKCSTIAATISVRIRSLFFIVRCVV